MADSVVGFKFEDFLLAFKNSHKSYISIQLILYGYTFLVLGKISYIVWLVS